jgi:phosphoglycolate phosphatase-like HAD superfamily hydrolase
MKQTYDYVIFRTDNQLIKSEGCYRNSLLIEALDETLQKYAKRDFYFGDDNLFEYTNVPYDELNKVIDMIKSTSYFRDNVEVKLVEFHVLDTLYPNSNKALEI